MRQDGIAITYVLYLSKLVFFPFIFLLAKTSLSSTKTRVNEEKPLKEHYCRKEKGAAVLSQFQVEEKIKRTRGKIEFSSFSQKLFPCPE